MKTISFKKKLILILSFVMCMAILASGAIFGVNTAKADATGFETVKGAEIRIHNEKERLGIRYQLRMESEKYNTFMATYTDVEFGAFIIPEDYRAKGAFTELNLFGGVVDGEEVAPIYYWGDVADEYKTGKTQIINLSTNAMTKIEEVDGVSYNTVYAAITNVKPQNVARAFAGVGYVKYTDGETVKYIISDNGSEYSYSIAQVADNALNNPEYQLEDDQVAAIEQITAIKPAVKVSAEKSESAIKTAVSELNYAMGAELDITAVAKANAPLGMIVDEENSVLTATVPFVGYAEFDVNYVYDIETLDGKNLLEYTNLFATDSLMGQGVICSNNTCWNQYLGISSEDNPYYPNKYINMYWHCWERGPYLYFNKDFTNAMIAEGNSFLTIVLKRENSAQIRLHNYNLETNSFGGSQGGEGVTGADGYITYTYNLADFTKFKFEDNIAICTAGGLGKLLIYDINFSKPTATTTGNIANKLKSSGFATSTKNVQGQGQLFHYGDNNTLYFNAWSGYGNYIAFDSAFVSNCFKRGLTNINIKYYVSEFHGGDVKLGPAKFDGVNKPAYLSSRAASPWLNANYNSSNPIETTWVITPEEVASFNFAAGDKFYIGEMASGSGKAQVVITHFEFCKPVDYNGVNLLSLENSFNNNFSVGYTFDGCVESDTAHPGCWAQYLDSTEYEGANKYINLKRNGYCHIGLYFTKQFTAKMMAEGNTTLTIVARKGISSHTMNCCLFDWDKDSPAYNNQINWDSDIVDGDYHTYTFDLSGRTFNNSIFLHLNSGLDCGFYIYDITFSKPA